MLIELSTGHETYSNPSLSCRVSCFYQRKPEDEAVSIYTAMKDKHSGLSMVTRDHLDASNYNRNHGDWNIGRFQAAEGSLITLSIEKRTTGVFSMNKSQIMLMVREQAALVRIGVKLTDHPKAAHSMVYLEGRFDIVRPEQFKDLGIKVEKRFLDLFDPEMYDDMIKVTVLERAISTLTKPKKDVIKTKSGGKVILKRNKRRRIRLD